MKKKVFYDSENDILTIHKGFSSDEKFKGNLDVGDLILDISTAGRIKGIEIMEASKFFKEEFSIEKEKLENIEDADFRAVIKPNSIFIGILFKSKNKEIIPAKIAVPLQIPLKH